MSAKPQQKVVAYYRVSTKKQGDSGLGLEAQQAAVKRWVEYHEARVVAVFQEIETGKRRKRNPELDKALSMCLRLGARLVIAKLDRLSRNVALIANLMESRVKFTICDMPDANDLTIHILAAVAQNEAQVISERTKAALAAAKTRGILLGASMPKCRNLKPLHQQLGVNASRETHEKNMREHDKHVQPRIRELLNGGANYSEIARQLNAEETPTRRGAPWNDVQVRRVLLRSAYPPTPIYRKHRRRENVA